MAFKEMLKELNEIGYIVTVQQNVVIVKEKDTEDIVKEIHPRNLDEKKTMLRDCLEKLKSKQNNRDLLQ